MSTPSPDNLGTPQARQLEALLLHPREGMEVEHKGWLGLDANSHEVSVQRASLAQAALALANYGGGFIVIGFAEVDGVFGPAPGRPESLSMYNQDLINGIVNKYADPPFHCECQLVHHPESGEIYPIIVVPGEHGVPVRAKLDGPGGKHVKANAYYTRRPGPKSEQIQSAAEWRELIDRCVRTRRQDLLDNIRSIVLGLPLAADMGQAQERDRQAETFQALRDWQGECLTRFRERVSTRFQDSADPYRYGFWTVAFKMMGDGPPQPLADFLNSLQQAQVTRTGWPLWLQLNRSTPYAVNGVVEAWTLSTDSDPDPDSGDFWRAKPDGTLFSLRAYQEDCDPEREPPRTTLDLGLPLWRIGEALEFAERLSRLIRQEPPQIAFLITWTGLEGRRLKNWARRNWVNRFEQYGPSYSPIITSERIIPADAITPNLEELVSELTAPLYEAFSFYRPSPAGVHAEIEKYRGRS